MNTVFPLFRKYPDDSSFFKIISEVEFEEVKHMPGGYVVFNFRARIFPDRQFIDDMIRCLHGYWSGIEEFEYNTARSKAVVNR